MNALLLILLFVGVKSDFSGTSTLTPSLRTGINECVRGLYFYYVNQVLVATRLGQGKIPRWKTREPVTGLGQGKMPRWKTRACYWDWSGKPLGGKPEPVTGLGQGNPSVENPSPLLDSAREIQARYWKAYSYPPNVFCCLFMPRWKTRACYCNAYSYSTHPPNVCVCFFFFV